MPDNGESVFCLGCGGTFPADADPYPLTNGMCAPCVREARRPNYQVVAENERLREALRQIAGELQALVDWFNDAPFPRAERLLHDLDEESGRDAR